MTVPQTTAKDLAAELDAMLNMIGVSTELKMLLGRIAGDSREFTGGDESPKKGAVIDVLRSHGARADRILSDENKAAVAAWAAQQRARQQAQRLGGAA